MSSPRPPGPPGPPGLTRGKERNEDAMDPLGLARWQFRITTVHHYGFVPITIGLALFITVIETAWSPGCPVGSADGSPSPAL